MLSGELRWTPSSLLPSSKCCTQLLKVEVVQISFGGSLPRETCLRSSPSLTPWLTRKVVASLGRVCGRLRLFRGRLFLHGRQPLAISLQWIISGKGMPKRVIDLFACWWNSRRPRSVEIWKMVPICIFWCVERKKY